MKVIRPLLALVLLTAAITPASAAVLFSNMGQTPMGINSIPSFDATSQRYAADFMTGANAYTVTGMTAPFANGDDINHTMIGSIYTDIAGVPGSLVGSFSSFIVPADSFGGGNYSFANFTGTSAGINLSASTRLLVGFFHGGGVEQL